MELKLVRVHVAENDTLGLLYINGHFAAVTMEDEYRQVKVQGETCIPEGTYELRLRYSPKFTPRYKHEMIEICDVPGFSGILVHRGNTEKDTAGCLLVGNVMRFNPDGTSRIEESTLAYNRIYPIIARAIREGPAVTLSISRL